MRTRATFFLLASLAIFPAWSAAAGSASPQAAENTLGMKFVLVPSGEFMMGSDESAESFAKAYPQYERKRFLELGDEAPVHKVRITRPFYLGQYEVTVGQFQQFLDASGYQPESVADGTGGYGYNPDYDPQKSERGDAFDGRDVKYSWRNPGFKQGRDHPVVNVTWNDAVALAKWLSEKEGKKYRLPTEAEWEYAARAGTRTRYHSGDDPQSLLRVANVFDADTASHWPQWKAYALSGRDGFEFTAPVGSFAPNALGLYDMLGNAWEWVADWYDEDYYAKSPLDNPQGPASGRVRVRRGGSWHTWPFYARSSYRNWNVPETRYTLVGMRLVREVDDEGIRFACEPSQIKKIELDMAAYLASLGISPDLIVKKADRPRGTLVYTLNTPLEDNDTLNLKDRPEMRIRDSEVRLPIKFGKQKKIRTVSKKEIMLALLQHGRLAEFKDAGCHVDALKDHVAIRQNTVAWAEKLEWKWPDGGSAKWNGKYWASGTPRPGFPLYEAVNDAFVNQSRYSIGCYTAAKLVMIQGVLDYYHRIKKDSVQLKRVEDRLSADKEPLVGIEPGQMWDFEMDFDSRESGRPGTLLQIQHGVAPKNFVPGDWGYFINTDPASAKKTGYEGSNPIYLGRNKFADYFNDNDHSYTYREKLDQVFQWRNGVFNSYRDAAKIKPLTEQDFERLIRRPAEGGLVIDRRVFPYVFGRDWGGDA